MSSRHSSQRSSHSHHSSGAHSSQISPTTPAFIRPKARPSARRTDAYEDRYFDNGSDDTLAPSESVSQTGHRSSRRYEDARSHGGSRSYRSGEHTYVDDEPESRSHHSHRSRHSSRASRPHTSHYGRRNSIEDVASRAWQDEERERIRSMSSRSSRLSRNDSDLRRTNSTRSRYEEEEEDEFSDEDYEGTMYGGRHASPRDSRRHSAGLSRSNTAGHSRGYRLVDGRRTGIVNDGSGQLRMKKSRNGTTKTAGPGGKTVPKWLMWLTT